MADSSPLMIWVHGADGGIQFVNKAYRDFFGVSPEEASGPDWQPLLHPDDSQAYVKDFLESLKERRRFHHEARVRRANGEWAWVESFGVPRFSPSGEFLGMVGSSPDITERKKAEEAVRESEERFRALSETSPVGVGVSSADGVLLYANPSYERILGYNRGELEGMKAFDLYLNPEDRRSWVDKMKRSGVVHDIETRLKRKDGTPVWVSINVSPVSYEGRQAVMGTVQDITERKQTEQIKDEFIGMVSHELRTPLTVVTGAIHTAMLEGLPPEELPVLLREAAAGAESLEDILDNLLELSRYQAKRIQLTIEPTHLRQIVDDVIERLKRKSSIHRLVREFPEQMVSVKADKVRVERIIHNLIENAIKYSPKGGEVRITARKYDGSLIVGVSDQGIGIAPEDQLRLFQPFQRLEKQEGYGIKGLGLGLSVCSRLVEAHHGRIWVESETGKGSTFYFSLPLDWQETGGS